MSQLTAHLKEPIALCRYAPDRSEMCGITDNDLTPGDIVHIDNDVLTVRIGEKTLTRAMVEPKTMAARASADNSNTNI